MPGYTLPDCLPYFLCSDSPCLNTGTECDHSSVFCDLTALVEEQLITIDNVIARTATTIPFAKVARVGVTQDIDTNVPGFDSRVVWNTVLADNNNMVDLDANSKDITISTPGLYVFTSKLSGQPPTVLSNILNHYITPGSTGGSFITESDSLWRSGTNYSTLTTQRYVSQFNIDNNGNPSGYPVSVNVGFQGTSGTGLVRVFGAELTVYWIGDAP